MTRLTIAKMVCAIVVAIVFGAMIRTFSDWTETRGVHDDVCYLRQAHLFQRFGVKGLDTDIAHETDGFLASRLRAIGYPTPDDPAAAPCHSRMPATGRTVMQYPPGTGFVLAAFPEGRQVVPLYMAVTAMLFALALTTIANAKTPAALAAATGLGVLSLYLMNNPMKSSYSLPPTMIVCALAGMATATLVATSMPSRRMLLAGVLGLVFGLGVDFRIASMFLLTGAGFYLAIRLIRRPHVSSCIDGVAFGSAALIGMAPTLLANAINAGSPLTTTYSGQDALPPDFAPAALAAQMTQYLAGTQGTLILLAIALTTAACWRGGVLRQAGWVVAVMLATNLVYFISHPVFTPYYAVPAAMLALWTLLFAFLRASGSDGPSPQQMLIRASL